MMNELHPLWIKMDAQICFNESKMDIQEWQNMLW